MPIDAAKVEQLVVFISYSRRDALDFADQLAKSLEMLGYRTSIDREGISGGELWQVRLGQMLLACDTVIFVMSPESAISPICAWEVEEAAKLSKRILPVIAMPLSGARPPERLQQFNFIYFYAEGSVPGSGFGDGLVKLNVALKSDLGWLREHTKLLERATEWERGGRSENRLLMGDDIDKVKAWADARPADAPEVIAVQFDFIHASALASDARLLQQKSRLEEQQRLTKAAEDGRKAVEQVLEAATEIIGKNLHSFDIASTQHAMAIFRKGAEFGDPYAMANLAMLLLQPGQDHAEAHLWLKRAIEKGNAHAMNGLGTAYEHGRGVEQSWQNAGTCYEAAAEKGDVDAFANLGALYQNGTGVAQDLAKARELAHRAADLGSIAGARNLNTLDVLAAVKDGRYSEALSKWEPAIAQVEASEKKARGSAGKETADALRNGCWLALCTRDFQKALALANKAREIEPENLEIELNRAHALLYTGSFLSRGREARAIYAAHKGQLMKARGRLWEKQVVEDFAQLKGAGAEHPLMRRIARELGSL